MPYRDLDGSIKAYAGEVPPKLAGKRRAPDFMPNEPRFDGKLTPREKRKWMEAYYRNLPEGANQWNTDTTRQIETATQ